MLEDNQTPENRQPFSFISHHDPEDLLLFLQNELPQTIAVVLIYLKPDKAALILQNLPDEIAGDVLRRIATLGKVNPEILREIEQLLEKKLSSFSSDNTTPDGIERVVEILNRVNVVTEKKAIKYLKDNAPELAEKITKQLFVFEDLGRLDDRDIQKILQKINVQDLAIALVTVSSEFKEKIFRNLSKRACNKIKKEINKFKPIHLSVVEEAQEKIMSVVRYLIDTGVIILPRATDELVTRF
jgi:flagellar motor switch protein FliG